MEQQQEQEIVRGVVQSVITKGPEKWQISVMPQGSQYAKNLWTKEQPLVNEMSMRIGQAFDFLCNASHWTRQDGQPVRSLWVQSVGNFGSIPDPPQAAPPPQTAYQPPAAAQPPPQQWQPPGGPQWQAPQQAAPPPNAPPMQQAPLAARLPDEVKELRIMRECAMKVAALLLPYLPPEQRNLSGLQIVAEWQVRYYTGGPQGDPWQQPQQQQAPPQQAPPQQQAQQYPAPYDGQPDEHAGDPGPQTGQYETQGGFPT